MEELDIKQIAKFMYKRRNILIYILLIAILIGMLYTFIIKRPNYEVTAQILIDRADASIENFVTSKDVLNRNEIQVEFNKTSKVININTEMNNAKEAFNITKQFIEELKTKLQENYNIKTFNVIESPKLPEIPNNISYGKDILFSILIGLVTYGIYIMLMMNIRGIVSSTEIENAVGINVLGEVSLEKKKDKKQIIPYTTQNENIINELKRIEANIEFNKEIKKPKIILFTGTKSKIGTSYIVNNLATQYAKIYNKVLIIDTDIFSKKLTEEYNKGEEKGLTNILEKSKIEGIEKLVQKTEKQNIFFMPVGNIKKEEDAFLQENISEIVEELKKKYDIVLIDTLSINKHILPIHLTNIADATVIVVESENTKIEDIQKAKTTIEKVDGKIVGIIINKVF